MEKFIFFKKGESQGNNLKIVPRREGGWVEVEEGIGKINGNGKK